MENKSKELLELAKQGENEAIFSVIENSDEAPVEKTALVYQWMSISAFYGSEEAEEIEEDIYEAELSRGGDETVSYLHFEIAKWFTFEENGLPKDEDMAIAQLEEAERFGLSQNIADIDKKLAELKVNLNEEHQKEFEKIFPNL